MNASVEDIAAIKDIGMTIAKSVAKFFSEERNKELISHLKEFGVNMYYLKELVIRKLYSQIRLLF